MHYRLSKGGIFFPSNSILCIADLHIGYEEELQKKGVALPATETRKLAKTITQLIAKFEPERIILNGDVKHSFSGINNQEREDTQKLFAIMKESAKVDIVLGNHDTNTAILAQKHNIETHPYLQIDDIHFTHGDTTPNKEQQQLINQSKIIVIGHEHPAIKLTEGERSEEVKCYLVGTYQETDLVVLPSMFSLTTGSDVLTEKQQSPYLKEIDSFKIYGLVDNEVLAFGSVGTMRRFKA